MAAGRDDRMLVVGLGKKGPEEEGGSFQDVLLSLFPAGLPLIESRYSVSPGSLNWLGLKGTTFKVPSLICDNTAAGSTFFFPAKFSRAYSPT
jgi:hypothetical protein